MQLLCWLMWFIVTTSAEVNPNFWNCSWRLRAVRTVFSFSAIRESFLPIWKFQISYAWPLAPQQLLRGLLVLLSSFPCHWCLILKIVLGLKLRHSRCVRNNKMVQESRVKTQLRRYSNVLYHLIVSDTTGMSQLKIPRGEFLVLDNDELCDET